MRAIRTFFVAFGLVSALVSAGCGGGGSDASSRPAFEIGVLVDGRPLANVDVLPGDQQTIVLAVGQSIELDSSDPVVWSLAVGGSAVPVTGGTVFYGGATIDELAATPRRFALGTSAVAPLGASVVVSVYATSTYDSREYARVDFVLGN